MAQVEQVLVNGNSVEVGTGLEGRIAQEIERSGAGSCVVVQVRIEQKSYSFTFPRGCAGGGGGGGGADSVPAELTRLNRIYQAALERLAKNKAAIRGVVVEFIKSL
jgi:hypothetical protein